MDSKKSRGAAATRTGQYKKRGAAAARHGKYKKRGRGRNEKGAVKKDRALPHREMGRKNSDGAAEP